MSGWTSRARVRYARRTCSTVGHESGSSPRCRWAVGSVDGGTTMRTQFLLCFVDYRAVFNCHTAATTKNHRTSPSGTTGSPESHPSNGFTCPIGVNRVEQKTKPKRRVAKSWCEIIRNAARVKERRGGESAAQASSSRMLASSSGVKSSSDSALKVARISSRVLPLIMLAVHAHAKFSKHFRST